MNASTGWKWLAELPTTNFRIFVSVLLAALLVLVSLGGMMLDRKVDLGIIGSNMAFLLTMMGLDVAQYAQKRKTYQPGPPASPDAEDAAAGANTTPSKGPA